MNAVTCMPTLASMWPRLLLFIEQGGNQSFLCEKQKLLFINVKLQVLALLWKEQKFRLGCEGFGAYQVLL